LSGSSFYPNVPSCDTFIDASCYPVPGLSW